MNQTVNGVSSSRQFKSLADRSPVEVVRQCLLEERRISQGSKMAGMDRESYAFIRRMIILRDRHIPHHHRETIDQALASVDQDKNTAVARQLAGKIVSDLWQTRTRSGSSESPKLKRRLEQTLMHIRESCETTRDMTIPMEITQEEAAEAVATLSMSVELISRLMTRLLGREGEET